MPASTPNALSSCRAIIPAVLLLLASLAGPPFCSTVDAQSPDSSFLAITPSAATISLTEEASFSVIDSTVRPLSSVEWSVNPPLADVRVENGEATVTAKQSGRVTLTATVGNQTASASLTILPGTTLPPATAKWSVDPTPGFATLLVRQAVPNPNSEVAFYSIEWNQTSHAVVRAFQESG